MTDASTGTFSRRKPTGTTDITQQTSPVVGVLTSGSTDEASAFWTAPYKRAIDSTVVVTWFWASRNAAAAEANLVAHLWADPGTAHEKELGSAITGVTIADGALHLAFMTAADFDGVSPATPRTLIYTSTDGNRSWHNSTDELASRPVFHSATANPLSDPIHRGTCLGRCAGMFDFLDVVIAPRTGEVWAAATDTCTSVACIDAQGPGLRGKQEASDAQGVAVRMLSGPGLRR